MPRAATSVATSVSMSPRVEAAERLLALGLRPVAVDRQRVHAVAREALDEPVGSALGAHEHERAPALAGGQLVDQRVELRLVGDGYEAVLHAPLARSLACCSWRRGLRVKAAATCPVAPSSVAEKKSVWRSRGERDDAIDGRAEAHVEHPVRLVEDQHSDGIESDGAALHEVLQAAGCGHQDVCPSGKFRLALDAGAAVDGCQRERPSFGDLPQVRGDLARELTRRHEHEGGRPRVLGLDEIHRVGRRTPGSCPTRSATARARRVRRARRERRIAGHRRGRVTPRAARARTTASDTPRSAKDC